MIHEDITLSGSFAISGSLTLPNHANSSSATSATGSMYHDLELDLIKVYNGTEWAVVGEQTGPSYDVEYLVVAGGGGGGMNMGGGGGAGGLLSSSFTIIPGTQYSITVGAGGAGAPAGGTSGQGSAHPFPYGGSNGDNSSFSSLTAL